MVIVLEATIPAMIIYKYKFVFPFAGWYLYSVITSVTPALEVYTSFYFVSTAKAVSDSFFSLFDASSYCYLRRAAASSSSFYF